MSGVSRGIIWRAGITRVVRVRRQPVIDRSKADDMMDLGIFEEKLESWVQLGRIDLRVPPGAAMNVSTVLVSIQRS